jgi:hypothetical protein
MADPFSSRIMANGADIEEFLKMARDLCNKGVFRIASWGKGARNGGIRDEDLGVDPS